MPERPGSGGTAPDAERGPVKAGAGSARMHPSRSLAIAAGASGAAGAGSAGLRNGGAAAGASPGFRSPPRSR